MVNLWLPLSLGSIVIILQKSIGFTPTVSDPRIYVKFYSDGTRAYISVPVDDLGITASNMKRVNEIKSDFLQKVYKSQFNIDFSYYLGMLIWCDALHFSLNNSVISNHNFGLQFTISSGNCN